MLSTFLHFPNEISTFSYRHRSASFAPKPSIENDEVERRSLLERSRSKSVAVRNVFRAVTRPDFSSYLWMFEIFTFSITFGALVLQTTVCVAFGARRRAAPARLLGDALATSDDGAGPEVRQVRVPPSFQALMSPESARIHASTPHREQFLRGRKWYPPQGSAP